jgi:hypothetical protein
MLIKYWANGSRKQQFEIYILHYDINELSPLTVTLRNKTNSRDVEVRIMLPITNMVIYKVDQFARDI